MGIPTLDLVYGSLAIAIVAIILAVWSLVSSARVQSRYLSVFGEDKPESVEQLVANLHQRLDQSVDRFDGFRDQLEALDGKTAQSISRIGLVRFNPFTDTGSDQSFSAALLNDKGDGIILTSLWGRDEVRLYAKPVDRHESRYVLSQEEKQALDMAKNARAAKNATSKT